MKHLTRQIRAPLRLALRISCLLPCGEWNVKMRWGEKCKFLKRRMDPLSPSPLSAIRFSSWSCQSLFQVCDSPPEGPRAASEAPLQWQTKCASHTPAVSVTQCLCTQRSRHFCVLDSSIFFSTGDLQVLSELQWQETESTYCSNTFKR